MARHGLDKVSSVLECILSMALACPVEEPSTASKPDSCAAAKDIPASKQDVMRF
jgi:hypothetical protein